jgi:Diacylglycerol acyltransferase
LKCLISLALPCTLNITGPLKITVVVGRPIPITQCAAPSDALVKKTMDIYMKALLAMFDKHKVAVGERPERRLVLVESDGKPYIFNDKSSHTSKMKST